MEMFKRIHGIFLLFLCLCCSCAGLQQQGSRPEFYTLEYNPPEPSSMDPLPVVIKIERFLVAPPYNTNQIIYRDSSFKRDSYIYHRWSSNPGDLVTQLLNRDFKRSGLFEAILPYETVFSSDYTLEGSLDDFLEWDRPEDWSAVLSVTIVLTAENDKDINKRILFQKIYRSEKACKQKNPQSLAEAMSRAMLDVSARIIRDVYQKIRDRTSKNPGK